MTAVFTIVSNSYLAFARTLMRSVGAAHPGMRRFVVLVDRPAPDWDAAAEDFDVILSESLPVRDSRWFHFKYNVVELSTALKPWAAAFIARAHSPGKMFYLDPDIRLYGSLAPLEQALERADIVLTPHLLRPMPDDGKLPGEFEIVRSGTYNLGFIGFAVNERTLTFLEWWRDRLYDHAYVDPDRGMFTDQKWIDLVPAVFDNVAIERTPAWNVAYWNIGQREVKRDPAGAWTVEGRPLGFFHFSGFDPLEPERFSKNQNRYSLEQLGDVAVLAREYAAEVIASGHRDCRAAPYAWGHFDNGTPIPDVCRRWARRLPASREQIADPFGAEGFRAFVDWWTAPDERTPVLPRLALAVYEAHAGIRRKLPDVTGEHRDEFLQWLIGEGKRNFGLPDVLTAAIEAVLARERRRKSEEARLETARRAVEMQWQALPPPLAELLRGRAEDASRSGNLRAWLAGNVAVNGQELPRLAALILEARPDLRAADTGSFLAWLATYGRIEYQLDAGLIAPIAARAARTPLLRFTGALAARSIADAARARPPESPALPLVEHAPLAIEIAVAPVAPPAPEPAARSGPAAIGLNVVAYLRAETGVGEAGRSILDAARAAGLPVSVNEFDADRLARNADYRAGAADNALLYDTNLFVVNADQTATAAAMLPEAFAGRYNIAHWVWELEHFPSRFASSFELYREIWVPSRFCLDAIARKSPVPVLRVPYAVEPARPSRLDREAFGIPSGQFAFLTMFDVLSVVRRKNPLGVVEAFRAANCDDAVLVMKINNARHDPAAVARIRDAAAGLPVVLVDRDLPRDDVGALIAACDCLVSLHRSEGFGLTLAEAMLAGKPVIATAYSGNTDFTIPGNSLLVDYDLVPVGPGAGPYDPEAVWAEPNLATAAAHMRAVVAQKPVELARRGQGFIREHYSAQAVGRLIRERLEAIRCA